MSSIVKEMNGKLASILKLVETECSEKNSEIRTLLREYFACAEEIKRIITTVRVSNTSLIVQEEYNAIEEQKQKVSSFIRYFDAEIASFEKQIRESVHRSIPLLQ